MNERDIIDMYVVQELSTYVIAEKYGTYPNKIRRLLIKRGIDLNDKSTAQKQALKAGRSIHPTEGKERSDEVKVQISESVYKYWQKLSQTEREERVEKAKDQWNNMTETERQNLRTQAALAVRKAAKEGSKMEKFLLDELRSRGYNIVFHKTGLIPNNNLEVDLFVPELKVAIEIDGPAHFFPIWGEKSLQKHVKADAHKSGILLSQGLVVVRIKHLTKSLSEKHKRDVLTQLLQLLKRIRESFPIKSKRYIELEVS